MNIDKENFIHPVDTILSSSLRFSVEAIAWVAGPWAMTHISNWLVAPALLLLIALPALFSTINDKHLVVIATPGPIRVVIELLLYCVAAIAPWFIWPELFSYLVFAIIILSLVVGYPRFKWLMAGAPTPMQDRSQSI